MLTCDPTERHRERRDESAPHRLAPILASSALRTFEIRVPAKTYPTPPHHPYTPRIAPLEGSRPLIYRRESEVIEREALKQTQKGRSPRET
jgi:hypothetical protein